ncbi:MAG TPA: Hpt domain-containing protein [Planctomycetota bacterium]|nr:Hpt domain-containing protein [Planctomycetota bacterium]
MVDPLLITFINEAKTHLAQVDVQLRTMDRGMGMAGSSAINACYRSVHTISGLAGYLALDRILVLAQSAEHLLEEMRTNRLYREAARIDALLRAVARLIDLVECLEHDRTPVAEADDQVIIGELRAWTIRPTSVLRRTMHGHGDHSVPRFSHYGNQIPSGPPWRTDKLMAGHV